MVKRCLSTLCCCNQSDDGDDEMDDVVPTSEMTDKTTERDRLDGLVRRKGNPTEESLAQSVTEMQRVNERLLKEMKDLKVQMLSARSVSPQTQDPIPENDEEEERKWVPPNDDQKKEIAQGWDDKSDELFRRILGNAGGSRNQPRELPAAAVWGQVSSAITRLHCMNPDIAHEQLFKIAIEETANAWEASVKQVLEAVDEKTKSFASEFEAKDTNGSWNVVQGQGSHPFEPLSRFRHIPINEQKESLTPRAVQSGANGPTSHPWSTPQPYEEDRVRYEDTQEERGRTKVKTPERERNHRSWEPPAHSGLMPGLPTFLDPPSLSRATSTPDRSHRSDQTPIRTRAAGPETPASGSLPSDPNSISTTSSFELVDGMRAGAPPGRVSVAPKYGLSGGVFGPSLNPLKGNPGTLHKDLFGERCDDRQLPSSISGLYAGDLLEPEH